MLRTLLAVALFAYPAEFRHDYRSQIFLDLDDRTGERGYAFRLFFDVVFSGIVMRAETLWRDVSYALRTLVKVPLFTSVIVGTLAVAIAGNAIIFGALDAVLLQPLPYAHAERLAIVTAKIPAGNAPAMTATVPATFVERLPERSRLIEAAGAGAGSDTHARVDGVAQALHFALVTPAYFETLGVRPVMGRFFGNTRGSSDAVISNAFWHQHYAANPSALGKQLRIDDKSYTIVGVAPPGMMDPTYGALSHTDVWTLIPHIKTAAVTVFPIVRARPGVSMTALQAELRRVWADSAKHGDAFMGPLRLEVYPLREAIFAHAQSLWILFGAVAAVLLVACANIANLMLTRGAARQDELAVRAALGAKRRRLAAQMLTETFVLSVFGCVLGAALAALLMKPAVSLIPGNLPRLEGAHLDANVVVYICGLGIAVTLLAGMVPALRAGSSSLVPRRSSRTRTALVAIEVGAALALLICSGLLLRSFITMAAQPPGFDPRGLYVATFAPKWIQDASGTLPRELAAGVASRVAARIRALPGVTDAAIGTQIPFNVAFNMMGDFRVDGEPAADPNTVDPSHMSAATSISPGFIPLMRIPVLQGRNFTNADLKGPSVVLVNRAFERQFFKGKAALGKRLRSFDTPMRIAGIVGDTRNSLAHDPKPLVYLPYKGDVPIFQVVFRMDKPSAHLAADIAAIAHALYPQIGTPQVDSLEDAVHESSADARASFLLLGALTLIALVLALAGVYGVVALSVQRRYHEIGVRVALGATGRTILQSIVGSALAQTLLGIGAGVILAAFVTRWLDTELFQTSPLDPATFVVAVALLLVCAALAAALPAWRAVRIDPAQTLRYE